MATESSESQSRWHVGAAACAWLLPGLGHYLLGQRSRGIVLGVSIGLLWLLGVLIGGVSVVDRKSHPAWFLGQMLVSPSVVVSEFYVRPMKDRTPGGPKPGEDPPYEPSFGRTNEVGILFTALAGMLNLLAIIDVAYRDPNDARYRREFGAGDAAAEGGAA